jgi:hypothetical protein
MKNAEIEFAKNQYTHFQHKTQKFAPTEITSYMVL